MSFEKLLIKLAAILEKLNIKYCITGGYAVSVWGRPRATFDIDVVVQIAVKDVSSLAQNLKSLSKAGYIEEEIAEKAARLGGKFNFIHPESGIKIDFWVIRKEDEVGLNELKRRIAKKIAGHTLYFISPEDLILSKLRWYQESQSSRQLEDVESIIKISGKELNMKYLKKWANNLTVRDVLDNLLQNIDWS